MRCPAPPADSPPTTGRDALRDVHGARTRTEPPSMMVAIPSPIPLFTLATSRVAVVKSGSFKFKDDRIALRELRRDRTLDRGTVRNAPRTRHIHRELRSVGAFDSGSR